MAPFPPFLITYRVPHGFTQDPSTDRAHLLQRRGREEHGTSEAGALQEQLQARLNAVVQALDEEVQGARRAAQRATESAARDLDAARAAILEERGARLALEHAAEGATLARPSPTQSCRSVRLLHS